MSDTVILYIPVKVPRRDLDAFREGLTGQDDDIVLSAEKAIHEHIDNWYGDHDPRGSFDDLVELEHPYTVEEMRDLLT